MMTEKDICMIYKQSQIIVCVCIMKCSTYLLQHSKSLKTMTEKLRVMYFVYKCVVDWAQQDSYLSLEVSQAVGVR